VSAPEPLNKMRGPPAPGFVEQRLIENLSTSLRISLDSCAGIIYLLSERSPMKTRPDRAWGRADREQALAISLR
jgi:hypothetical protein